MVRVPRVEPGGRSRNPAKWLSAAALAIGNSVVTQIAEIKDDAESRFPSAKRAEAGLAIRKYLPSVFGDDALDSTLTIPNPDGLNCYDAIMYAIDALENWLSVDVDLKDLKSEIAKHKGNLLGPAGKHKPGRCGGYWIHLDHVQRAGALLYILQEGLHDISNEEEMLERFRQGIVRRVYQELEIYRIYHTSCKYKLKRTLKRKKGSKPSTLAARKMASVPRVEHGGQSRIPANWLGAAESPSNDQLAEAGLVIRKLLPDEIANPLGCIGTIPNPANFSCYDAIMYAINALPEESVYAMDAFRSVIDTYKEFLVGRPAEKYEVDALGDYDGHYDIEYIQGAGLLLYILQEGLHDISNEEELLKRFRRGILSTITEHIERSYLWERRDRLPDEELLEACPA